MAQQHGTPQPDEAPPKTAPAADGRVPGLRRFRKEARLARIYDSEILPLWTRRFGRMLLRCVQLPARGTALDVLCGTGDLSLSLLRRSGPAEGLRVIAIDPSAPMLDVARQKAGTAFGRRIFFRSDPAEPRLPFDSDVYDLVVCNLGLHEVGEPRRLLQEMVCVAKPGAQVLCTLPLRGTFFEFHDLFDRTLRAQGLTEGQERLSAYLSTMPSAVEAKSWLVEAGLSEARVECGHFTLLFAGGREFFFAPVIEYGPLSAWKEVCGAPLQEVFHLLKEEIDHQCQGAALPLPFAATVRAGCLLGRKTTQEKTKR